MPYIGRVRPTVALSADDIEASAITSAKIADGAIVNADINASSAIAQSKLATLAITDSEVADNALSGNKIDGGTISNFASTGIDDNADALAITIDSSERVGIGESTPGSRLQVGATSGTPGLTSASGTFWAANRTINAGGTVHVMTNDSVATDKGGSINLGGNYSGTSASIDFAQIAGRSEAGGVLGYMSLGTRSASAETEKIRIGSSGQLGIGGATYGTSGQVLTSGGASAAPSWADAGGGSPAAECAFRVKKNATQSSSQNAYSTVTWQTSVFDVGSDFDMSNNRFVAPNAGTYYFRFQIATSFVFQNIEELAAISGTNSSGGGAFTVAFRQDEPINPSSARGRAQGWYMDLLGLVVLAVGDRITCHFRSEGDTKTITSGNGTLFEGYQLI